MIALGSLVLAFLTHQNLVVCLRAADAGRVMRAESQRVNRDTSGLIPFPRVGRGRVALSALSYLLPLNVDDAQMLRLASPVESDEPSWDVITDILKKGGGLIPFPRSGRSGTGPKRNGAGSGGSLWFGPRLGKRSYYLNYGGTGDMNALTSVPDYFNQNKMAYDDSAASVKMVEPQ